MQKPLAHPFRLFARALIILIVVFCAFGFLATTLPVSAQETAFEQFGTASTLPTASIAIIIARVIRAALGVVGIIFVVLIIYAGFLYLLARGEVEPVKKAKKIFQQSIIGLLIIFSAYSIATFILNRLLDAAFTGTSASIADAYAEPLSGSLGGGILDDHYPERNATEIPRNTRIFITFKEAVNPETISSNYDGDTATPDELNTDSVLIYPTADGSGKALGSTDVVVTYDDALEIWVFDPVDYLGSSEEDTNYTVVLTTNIEKDDGSAAFAGTYSSGYAWTFEVSTEIDLTPPYVTSVVPQASASEPRNVTLEINFSEAMDPVATTGSYILSSDDPLFTNVIALDEERKEIEGTWEISNAYRTLSFTTIDACGEDPCGDTIYCLPTDQLVTTTAKAATLKKDEIPQADPTGYTFDGVVDAASNSLGDSNGESCGSLEDGITCDDGSPTSDYEWSFTTTNEIEDTVPQIIDGGLDPGVEEGEISQSDDVEVTFNTYLKSSTLKTSSVSLWPDPYYEFWFAIRKSNNDFTSQSTVLIEHPSLVSTDAGWWDYWPVLTSDIKSAYQICMYPAIGPGAATGGNCTEEDRDADMPYCCNGVAFSDACQTQEQESIEESPVPEGIEDYELPNNIETEL